MDGGEEGVVARRRGVRDWIRQLRSERESGQRPFVTRPAYWLLMTWAALPLAVLAVALVWFLAVRGQMLGAVLVFVFGGVVGAVAFVVGRGGHRP